LRLLSFLLIGVFSMTNAAEAMEIRIHLNQVTLDRNGPKSAVVETNEPTAGGHFTVLDGDKSVLDGDLSPASVFDAWGARKAYYRADFSQLHAPGSYRLKISFGSESAISEPVTVSEKATFRTFVQALLSYYRTNRHTDKSDHHIRIYGTNRFVDVWGGWQDAGGDKGKYLSHLSYANFFNPQQTGLVPWALARSYSSVPSLYREAGLEDAVIEEVFWGADYLHRTLDPDGYFYETVFDRWGEPGVERVVTAYSGSKGVCNSHYHAAFRQGAGVAIAALARAAALSEETGKSGAYSGAQYLDDAERAFAHLVAHNVSYTDDGKENIIDDYTALLAAAELYRATKKPLYLAAARQRAANLNGRLTADGWFRSDDGDRPFYHGVDAGLPIVALVQYAGVETDDAAAAAAKATITKSLEAQLQLDAKVTNPFDYPRQSFRTFKNGKLSKEIFDGFFMPHANETGYWWQGENARLASLATAAIEGGRIVTPQANGAFGVRPEFADFAQQKIDWILGRNPFDICLIYGFGAKNPPRIKSAGDLVKGGISNGITGAPRSPEGRGISFAAGPDGDSWRWVEQWLPHSTWFLLAMTAMAAN
jgi:hypothetical protein